MGVWTLTTPPSENRKDSVLSVDRFNIRKYPSQIGFEEHIIYTDLSPSIRLLYLLGIFPQDETHRKNAPESKRMFGKLFGVFLHIWWFYCTLISSLSVTRVVKNLQTNFSINFMNILIVFISLILHRKRNQIPSVIRSIEELHLSVSEHSYKPIKKALRVLACVCVLATAAQIAVSIEYLKVAGYLEGYSNDFQLGLNITEERSMFFTIYPKIIFTITVFYHHFTPMALCIFICSIYITFKNVIVAFRNKVKSGNFGNDIDSCASAFNNMVDVMCLVEDLLSAVTLLLYGILFANQLCVITHCINGGAISSHPMSIMMETVLTIKNTSVFFVVTLTSSSVTDAMYNLANEIKRLTADSRLDFEKLSLLMHNVSTSSFSFTAWGMFSLRKSLILTTASVMISYAMLLMQFAQKN